MYQHIGLVAGYCDAADWTEVLFAPCFLRGTLVMMQSHVMFVLHFYYCLRNLVSQLFKLILNTTDYN